MPRLMIVLVTASLIVAAGSAFGAELVINPGFEEIDAETGFPTGWEPTYWSNPKGTIEAAEVARTGERSVVLRGLPREQITDRGGANNHLVVQTIELSGTRRLTLRVYARTRGGGSAYVSMMTHDGEGNRLQYSSTQRYEGIDDWQPITWSFTTNADTERLQIMLRNGGEGDVYYDDVSLSSPEDVLDSGMVAAIVDSLVGGRISSLKTLGDGRELTPWSGVHPGGLTGLIVPGDEYPGLLRDVPWQLEVVEPNRKLALRHAIEVGDLQGLAFEKTLSVSEGSATVRCDLTVRNEADAARTLSLRTQECLPPGMTTFTWPTERGLRVYRHPEHILKRAVPVDDLAGDWMAGVDADGNGMVLRFDGEMAEKGHIYTSRELDTMEIYYRASQLAPGDTWQVSYSVTPISGAGGVVYAGDEIAISLDPLQLRAETDYAAILHALGADATREITVRGTMASGDVEGFEDTFTATGLEPSRVGLPWANAGITRIELAVQGFDEPIVVAQETLDDSPIRDLPEPPQEVARYPALEGIFPYGEYYRGYVETLGTVEEYTEYQLDTYAANSFNTWIIGEGSLLGPFRENGTSWRTEMAAERGIRVFPKGDFLRVFERSDDGRIQREIYPGDYTRETAIERIEEDGYDLELRKRYAEVYGDDILAYDLADEPGPEHIHNYMMVQSIFREIDPHHPAVTILNFSRTEFLPYMPVYYGDEYPIRNSGRDPWSVFDVVQFASRRTPAPVWVMLQAFGGLPEYTWQLPTGPEMRLMLWGAIAAGCDGITFHGSFSPPNWRVNKYYFYTAIDSFGAKTPCWDAMVDVGREITAIGPSMLDCTVDTFEAFSVQCGQLENYRETYTGPAVRLGVLKQPGADGGRFLVAVNQHLDSPQQARLLAREGAVPEGAVLVDLHDAAASVPASEPCDLTLEPGGGRIFFCGTAEQAAAVTEAVVAKRAENAARIDLPAMPDLDEVQELLSQIAQAFRDNWDVVVPPEDREGVGGFEVWENTGDPLMQQYVDEVAQAFLDRIALMRRIKAGEAAAVADEVDALVERAERLNADVIPYVKQRAGEAGEQ